MNQVQPVIHRFWYTTLVPLLLAMGQLIALFAVAIAVLWPVPVTSDQLFAIWGGSDLVVSHWPTALLIQRTFASNHLLALWDPYFGGGQPLAGNPLAALFYPPTQLVHFFSLRNYYLVLIMGHLVVAGLGMLLLARRAFSLPRLPALIAAISYMATPKLVAHLGAGHITMVQTVAWYPWLALACWATVREPRRWGALLGICIALTLLAGHPQIAYYGLLMIAGLSIWLLVGRWRREGWRAQWAIVIALVAAAVIGILLAAIHLLPLAELTAHSTRQTALYSDDAFPLLNFLRALITQPPPGSGWEAMVAPGWTVLALALLAVVRRWHKSWPLVLGIALVATLVLGNASPLYIVVVRILPGLGSFRSPARIWFVALVQIALLAGLGADILLHGIQHSINLLLRGRQRVVSSVMIAAGVLMAFVVAFSLVIMDVGYTRVNNVSVVTTPSALTRAAVQLAGTGKIYGAQENIPQLSAVQLHARLADGQDPLLIESYVSYMQQAGGYTMNGYNLRIPYDSSGVQPDARLLGLMGVSVVVSRRPLIDPRLVLVENVENTLLYKNTAYAGPGYLIRSTANGNPPALHQVQQLDANVHMVIQDDEQSTFTFSANAAAYFVLATPAFPGWTVSLDGHPVPIHLFAGVMPAIKVGSGVHTLIYSYNPSSVGGGAVISVPGLLLALAWFILGRFLKPGKPRRPLQVDKGRKSEASPLKVATSAAQV